MEFEAIMTQALPQVTGTSARGEWVKQEVVFEQPGDFGRKVCVAFWGDKAQDAARLVPGERVKLSVNAESREYNGRWYTELRAWKLERAAAGAPAQGGYAAGAPAYGAPQGGYGAAPQGGGYGAPQGAPQGGYAAGGGFGGGVAAPAPAGNAAPQGGQHAGTEYDWGTPARSGSSTVQSADGNADIDDLPF